MNDGARSARAPHGGSAQVLGRSDIASLAPGKCADFFSLGLNTVAYAGGLHDPVAPVLFGVPNRRGIR